MALINNCKNQVSYVYTNPVANQTFTTTAYVVANWNDVALLLASDFINPWTKAIIKAVWKNSSAGATNYVVLVDQFNAAAQVSGSELSGACASANTNYSVQTATPFALLTGLKDYMFAGKASAGTMTLVSSELDVVLA